MGEYVYACSLFLFSLRQMLQKPKKTDKNPLKIVYSGIKS